jgi:hypothetical protein
METILLLSALGVIVSAYTKNNNDIPQQDNAALVQLQKDIQALRELKLKEMSAPKDVTKEQIFYSPFTRPEKLDDYSAPPLSLRPIATRGPPSSFNYVGNAIGPDRSIVKLFGRPKYRGSTEFEYYALYPNNNDVTKIPLDNIKKEIFEGDQIKIPFLSGDDPYTVNIFKDRSFEYYPDYL